MAIKSSKKFNGEHGMLAPINKRTEDLIPGMPSSIAETWEEDTKTLLPKGVSGPMDPAEAGYHDSVIRQLNTDTDNDKDYLGFSNTETYIGRSRNEDNSTDKLRDSTYHSSSVSPIYDLTQLGDYRVGGRAPQNQSELMIDPNTEEPLNTGRTAYFQDSKAFDEYLRGVSGGLKKLRNR